MVNINSKRSPSREIQFRIKEIMKAIKVDDESIENLLLSIIIADENNVENVLRFEGELSNLKDYIFQVENMFLEKRGLDTIYKFKDIPSEEWDFLSKEENIILYNLGKYYKNRKMQYLLAKADMMILRKEAYSFIKEGLRKINSTINPIELINYIINNYSYIDTLRNLGINPTEENGEIVLNKYKLDPDTLVYK